MVQKLVNTITWEQPVRRDAIFYDIFQRFPSLLFTIVDQPPAQGQGYRFESVEVKEPDFRIDGVFLPPANAAVRMVYFAEFQFQKDEGLYHRFFCEVLLYLYRNQDLYDDWYGVLIFPSRSLEPKDTTIHKPLIESNKVQRIYLDELGDPQGQPIGVNLLQLTIASKTKMVNQAQQLMERAEQEGTGGLDKDEIIEVITKIAVSKFADLSREEVEAMLGVAFEESRIYQEVKEEGREEMKAEMLAVTVPLLLNTGMTLEQIAEHLKVDVEAVRQATQDKS